MPAQLRERTLAEWREGERLLHEMPRVDPDHETVRMAVIRLRDTYDRLSKLTSESRDQLVECQRNVEAAHEAIVRVRARHDDKRTGNVAAV
jgi:hypothetical protein